jgi:hypothetical protein
LTDPIIKFVQSAIIGLIFNDPGAGKRLSGLKIIVARELDDILQLEGGLLLICRERVKDCTSMELRTLLQRAVTAD